MRYLRQRIGGLLAAVCFVLIAFAGGASAHAVLRQSDPPANAVLQQAPARITLTFNEPVDTGLNLLTVEDQSGVRVDKQDAQVAAGDPRTLSASLSALKDGTYTVTWHVTSVDGHPVRGTFSFAVGAASAGGAAVPPAIPATPPAGSQDRPAAADALTHGATQAAAVALAGLTLFMIFLWQRPEDGREQARLIRWVWLAFGVLAVAGAAELMIYASRASGAAIAPALVALVLGRTRVGILTAIRILTGLTCAIAITGSYRRASPAAQGVAAVLVPVLLITLTAQSHAAADGRLPALVADWVHLMALAVWMGGLLGLACLVLGGIRRSEEGAARLRAMVARFSKAAIVSVLVVAISGLYSATLHIPEWRGLTDTAYGHALLWKLGLLVPLLVLGGFNMTRRGKGPFGWSVTAELLLAVGIFVAAGFLTSLPPAATVLEQTPFQVSQKADSLNITLRVDPARMGEDTATITVRKPDGTPLTGARVWVEADSLEMPMGVQNPEAKEQGNGVYQTTYPITVSMSGRWQVNVAVETSPGQVTWAPFTMTVPEVQQP